MRSIIIGAAGVLLLALPALLVVVWIGSATDRLASYESAAPEEEVAVAAAANEDYCTGDLKKVLRRVLQSCGLLGSGRGGVRPSGGAPKDRTRPARPG